MRLILIACLLTSLAVAGEDPFKVGDIKVHCDCNGKWAKDSVATGVLAKLPKHGKLFIKHERNMKSGALGETRTHTS